jgi:hypothetical protein
MKFGGPPDVRRLVIEARQKPVLVLPQYRPAWAAHTLVLAGVIAGAGVAAGRLSEGLGWLALVLILAGGVVHWRRQRRPSGWSVDFERRTLSPLGAGAASPALDDRCTLRTVAGQGAGARAVEVVDGDGRPLRLFEIAPTVNHRETQAVRELADVLSERLRVQRANDPD